MKLNGFELTNHENEKKIFNDEQYEINKELEWEKDRRYVSNQIAKIIAFDVKQIEQIAESMSDRRVASRLLTKFFERKMEFFIHPQYRTRWHKTPEGAIATGRFLSDFDISKERNGVHMFGQVRLSKSADRVLDFVLISKKDDFIKKFAIECQTNLGHLKPHEKHKDCVLAREITLRTDFVFLEYSSRDIFYDSNISSLDELVDQLEFGNNSKIHSSDIPF